MQKNIPGQLKLARGFVQQTFFSQNQNIRTDMRAEKLVETSTHNTVVKFRCHFVQFDVGKYTTHESLRNRKMSQYSV